MAVMFSQCKKAHLCDLYMSHDITYLFCTQEAGGSRYTGHPHREAGLCLCLCESIIYNHTCTDERENG